MAAVSKKLYRRKRRYAAFTENWECLDSSLEAVKMCHAARKQNELGYMFKKKKKKKQI